MILKHYLLLENNDLYLNHFVNHNQAEYMNQLIDRFNQSSQNANVQWMISDLLKLVTFAKLFYFCLANALIFFQDGRF